MQHCWLQWDVKTKTITSALPSHCYITDFHPVILTLQPARTCMQDFIHYWLISHGCSAGKKCASACVVECWICNWEVAGSNLGLGYFAPRSTQPSIPPGSVNEYQLRLGRQRQVWLIPIVDERVGVQVKLWNPSRTRAIPERFCGGDSLRRGATWSVCTLYLYL